VSREIGGSGRTDSKLSKPGLRAIAVACRLAVTTGLLGFCVAWTQTTGVAAATAPVQLGMVGTSGQYFAAEQAAGLQLVVIGVSWSSAEPTAGGFNGSYLSSVRAEIAAARSRSLGVVLDPGLQYPPAWVFSLPGGTRFVDQFGDVYTGPAGSGENVANAVTDNAVRAAEATYLRSLSAQIPGTDLAAVRTGGGPDGELRYPTGEYNGHVDAFWAYDPSSQAVSPVPGWRPGTGTQTEASRFLAAYNHDINAYGAWLDSQMVADFHTRQLIMLPGWGERPGAARQEVSDLLTLGYDEFSQGLDWADLLPSLPNRAQLVAYTTYLDGPTVEPTLQLEDPISYIAYLAKPLGMALGGENTGNGSVSTLSLVVNRALSLHLLLIEWMDESQVVASTAGGDPADPAGPTFASLAAAATSLGNP
jgi:hypothetical protein